MTNDTLLGEACILGQIKEMNGIPNEILGQIDSDTDSHLLEIMSGQITTELNLIDLPYNAGELCAEVCETDPKTSEHMTIWDLEALLTYKSMEA